METGKGGNYRALAIVVLLAIIAFSSIVAWSKYRPGRSVEISLPPTSLSAGSVYIGGAVSNPGWYSVTSDDSLMGLIQAAGGTTSGADLDRMKFYVPRSGEGTTAPKIDINRAETWLLMALPGIGETRARAIVEYRRQHGPFRNINELTKVEGIGTTTYEQIKHLVTVAN